MRIIFIRQVWPSRANVFFIMKFSLFPPEKTTWPSAENDNEAPPFHYRKSSFYLSSFYAAWTWCWSQWSKTFSGYSLNSSLPGMVLLQRQICLFLATQTFPDILAPKACIQSPWRFCVVKFFALALVRRKHMEKNSFFSVIRTKAVKGSDVWKGKGSYRPFKRLIYK